MSTLQTLINQDGDIWTVEYRESQRLTRIGGFLMTYGAQSSIILSKKLTDNAKDRGHTTLLEQLYRTPIGKAGTTFWEPET